MTVLYENFQVGTITDNPLGSGSTTINSAGFSDLPVVSGGDTMTITLDPEAVNGDPEIVTVTAHSASASSVTVTRASEGTTARSHPSGTEWRNTLTAEGANRLSRLGAFCTVRVSTQTISDNSATAVLFDTEVSDTLGWHSTVTNTDRITPTFAGLYLVMGYFRFVGIGTATTRLMGTITKNGSVQVRDDRYAGPGDPKFTVSFVLELNGTTDYVGLTSFQNDGGSRDIDLTEMAVVLLNPT